MGIFRVNHARQLISDYDNPRVPNWLEEMWNQSLKEGNKLIEAYADLEQKVVDAEEVKAGVDSALSGADISELKDEAETAYRFIVATRDWMQSDAMLIWKFGPQALSDVLGDSPPIYFEPMDGSYESYLEKVALGDQMLEQLSHPESGHIADRVDLLVSVYGETRSGLHAERTFDPVCKEHLFTYIREIMENKGEKVVAMQQVLAESPVYRRYLDGLEH